MINRLLSDGAFPFWKAAAGGGLLIAGFVFVAYFVLPAYFGTDLDQPAAAVEVFPAPREASHLKPPPVVRGIYLTSFVAGSERFRSSLVELVDRTELNAVVIDIKDYSGRVAFPLNDPMLARVGSAESRIRDIFDFLEILHKKGIYVIGRIVVFQDLFLTSRQPELAVKRPDGSVWKDFKGLSWIDPGAKEYWRYISALAVESYKLGFDELQFDYIRFPSDGDMKNIIYPWSGGRTKADVLDEFFSFLSAELRGRGIPISADIFGMTTIDTDDLNIGQIFERILTHFDYISPMVYPSHYPPNFNGVKNSAAEPYEVVRYSLDRAMIRASTTPSKIRPWLQDFSLGANYTAEMIKAEIQAVYDSGFESWLLWSPSNKYTEAALVPAK